MINDDLVNRENSGTKEQIAKVIDWWKLARSLLESKGLEVSLGTRWFADDLYGYMLKEFLGLDEAAFKEHRKIRLLKFTKTSIIICDMVAGKTL